VDIVLASSNPGKLKELQVILAGHGLRVRLQSDFSVPQVEETGTTFIENAIIKARHAAGHTQLPALADDSGIVIDALGGAPGVHSARYAASDASDYENRRKLLRDMQRVPTSERSCRFICVIAYLGEADDPLPITAVGVWEGTLLDAPRGSHGFGYDPLFYVPDQGCTSAELEPEVKNRISHRSRALKAFLLSFRAR